MGTVRATAKSMFDAIDEPTRLSQLLARTEEVAAAVGGDDDEPLDSGFLVAATVHAAHRAWATRLAGALWAIASWWPPQAAASSTHSGRPGRRPDPCARRRHRRHRRTSRRPHP